MTRCLVTGFLFLQTDAETVRAKEHCGAILAGGCGLRQAKTMTISGTRDPMRVSSVELINGAVKIESIWEMSVIRNHFQH
jgi:hypothetical protein